MPAPAANTTELKNLIVWVKDNGGMGTFYRSRHELVFAFKHGTEPHINTFELGRMADTAPMSGSMRGVNTLGGPDGRAGACIRRSSRSPCWPTPSATSPARRIVLDPFAGSGTTLIAAEKTGRQARCIEYEPKYCDVIRPASPTGSGCFG